MLCHETHSEPGLPMNNVHYACSKHNTHAQVYVIFWYLSTTKQWLPNTENTVKTELSTTKAVPHFVNRNCLVETTVKGRKSKSPQSWKCTIFYSSVNQKQIGNANNIWYSLTIYSLSRVLLFILLPHQWQVTTLGNLTKKKCYCSVTEDRF